MSTSGAQATEATIIPSFAPFDTGDKGAVIVMFLVALLSTLVLSFVLLCVAWVFFSATYKRTSCQNLSREAFFFRSQLGQYATCLLLSNWIGSVSGSIDINWISGGGVKAGSSCIAQGSLRQIGQYASFFFIVAMGIHTFNTLVLRNRPPQWLGMLVISIGWGSALIIGVAPVLITSGVNGPLYNVDGLTCDISKAYEVAHMFLYFLPLFLALLLSAIIYSLIFLMLRGTLAINGGLKIHIDPERRSRLLCGNFEEYQRFVYSVARTMLWLPISFVLTHFASSLVQLMEISDIAVSHGAMAFSCFLERLDGVINVLVLFNVLRALGPAMKSTVSTDSEKGRSERGTVSHPTYDWKPQPTPPPDIQEPVTKTAPPAHSPDSVLQGGPSNIYSMAKSMFRPHKKTESTTSSTHLLVPARPSRSHSPTSSLERPESSSSSRLVGSPIAPASVLDAGLAVPSEVIQKSTQPAPRVDRLTKDLPPQHDLDSAGLSPPPRGRQSRISRDLRPISVPPFLEVTLCSPTTSPTVDGVGSLINMYISRYPTMNAELPPFPDTAGHRASSVFLPLSSSELPVSPTASFPEPSAVDLPVSVRSEGDGHPLKAAVSIGAVGGRPTPSHPPGHRPELPAHTTSPVDALQSLEGYADREANASAQSRTSHEGQSSGQDRPALRALPSPPSRPALSSAKSVQLHKSPSSSSSYGYL